MVVAIKTRWNFLRVYGVLQGLSWGRYSSLSTPQHCPRLRHVTLLRPIFFRMTRRRRRRSSLTPPDHGHHLNVAQGMLSVYLGALETWTNLAGSRFYRNRVKLNVYKSMSLCMYSINIVYIWFLHFLVPSITLYCIVIRIWESQLTPTWPFPLM